MPENIHVLDAMMFNTEKLTASYLVGKNDEFALIETGPQTSAKVLLNQLQNYPSFSSDKLKYIITTHIHLDHAGGVGTLLKEFPNATAVHHKKTTRHLEDPTRLWDSSVQTNQWTAEMYGKPEPISPEKVISANHGDIFNVDNIELEIVDAPGHHSYHYAILDRNTNTMFMGDSAGWYWEKNNILFPTTPPPRYNHSDYVKTIKEHIKKSPDNIAFTHFDIVSENVEDMLYRSLDVVELWFDLVKEYRQQEKTITVKDTVNKLIKEKYPEYIGLDEGLKGAMFEIPILGMFHHLDQMELNPTKL